MDKMNRALLVAAVAIGIFSIFFSRNGLIYRVLTVCSTLCIVYGIFRMFSRNIPARQSELYKYMGMETRVRAWWARCREAGRSARHGFHRQTDELRDRREYKYLSCPQCAQRLRVPRGKGRLRVTCTRCGCKFETKS